MEPKGITKSTRFAGSLEPIVTGDVAADAFACFDRGLPPDEVVTELVFPVDTVEYLWRTWARLRGLVPLSREAARTLREALYSNRPIASGSDAVAAVRRFVERKLKPCPRCKDGVREYCTTCPSKEATRAGRGALRGSAKKRAVRPRAVETAPAPQNDASSDAIADGPRELIEPPCSLPWESR